MSRPAVGRLPVFIRPQAVITLVSEPKSHWSAYWATGALTSLPQDFAENYSGALAAHWESCFRSLSPGARILDVCTGNGAIALLAARWAAEHDLTWRIRAVDAARIDTARIADRNPRFQHLVGRVEFEDGVPLENRSDTADAYDLVTSQYGIEYCDWQAVAPRIAEWLKPGGRFICVTHAPDSAILATMSEEAGAYDRVRSAGVFRAFRSWLSGKSSEARFRRDLAGARRELLAGAAGRPQALEATVVKRLEELMAVDKASLRQLRPRIETFYGQLLHGRERLQDLLDVNRALHDNPEWYDTFIRAGLELTDSGEIRQDGEHRSGRYYHFRKNPG